MSSPRRCGTEGQSLLGSHVSIVAPFLGLNGLFAIEGVEGIRARGWGLTGVMTGGFKLPRLHAEEESLGSRAKAEQFSSQFANSIY